MLRGEAASAPDGADRSTALSERRRPRFSLVEVPLFLRAMWFVGARFACPCCGWRLRAFVSGGASLRSLPRGFCPRCGAKARHRRLWLFLRQHTNLFSEPLRCLEVSPRYAFWRRLSGMDNLDYVAADLRDGRHVRLRMDLTAAPIRSESFDAAICVHVLEEIADDRAAMRELFRVLRPGGWALVSVPTRMDRDTYEDASIVDPKDRKRAFGERAHVRVYGRDLGARLASVGFDVRVDLATDVEPAIRDRFGLKDDENVFLCGKPA